jgi:muramoyltetrapeptide carboxypeptidase LdcA involved in peptidoglycan recycling
MEVLEFIEGTCLWPEPSLWEKAVFFIETTEEMPVPGYIRYWLRNYAAQGILILQKLAAIIIGRLYKNYVNNTMENYDEVILQVVRDEHCLKDLPIITRMDLGHTDPSFIIPYEVMAEVDCLNE